MVRNTTVTEPVKAAIINVEPAEPDDSVELDIVLFTYDPQNFAVREIIDSYSGHRAGGGKIHACPVSGKFPLAELAEDSFDTARINKMLEEPEILIAHSAESAQSFVCRLFDAATGKRWKCSHRDIDWNGFGMKSRKLSWLLKHHKIEKEPSGNENNSAFGLLKLLTQKSPDGRPYLSHLLKE